jgi:hypothetical protein
LRGRRFLIAGFLLHFLVLFLVCFDATLWVLGQGYTFLPHSLDPYWQRVQGVAAAALGRRLSSDNPARITLNTYLHAAGIEGGYGFFAPDVPNSYKLVFELHYLDGKVEYELPIVRERDTGVRLGNLLDLIGRTHYAPLRELMIKMLAYSVWQEHPEAVSMRAVFGYIESPDAAQFKEGKKESYVFLYAYDFSFRSPALSSPPP